MKSKQDYINEIVKIARSMKACKEDIIIGIRKIRGLWHDAELPQDDLFFLIVGLEGATEDFIKGEDQQKCSAEFLVKQKINEEKNLEYPRPHIEKAIEQLLQLPFVEIPEDPYAWPFEEYK